MSLSSNGKIFTYRLKERDIKLLKSNKRMIFFPVIFLIIFLFAIDIIWLPVYIMILITIGMGINATLKNNSFTIYKTGIHPPVRPLTELFNTNYFIPYNKIRKAKYEETHYKGTPYAVFEFWLYLTNGKIIKINTEKMPLSLLESKRKKEMLKVMKMFNIIADEINSKEFQEKRKKGKEVKIGKELFEEVLDE